MITIHCSNPICGKSFLYDEEKFPGAKKVQCPYCKTIQDLVIGKEETPFFEEKPEPEPEMQKPEETFSATPGQEEEFYSTGGGEEPPPPQAARVSEEPRKFNPWWIIAPLLLIAVAVLVYLFLIKPKPLPPLADYELQVSGMPAEVEVEEAVVLGFSVTPLPDSGLVVRYFAGEMEIPADETGAVKLDTAFSEEGAQQLAFYVEVWRMADSTSVRDTATIAVKVNPEPEPDPGPGPTTDEIYIDLYRQASSASWTAVYPKNPPVALPMTWKEELKRSGDFYGQVQRVRNVKMENGLVKSGIGIATGDKRNSRVYGVFKVSKLPKKPEFTAFLGYQDAKESATEKGEVIFEFRVEMKDGTVKKIGEKGKKYNERLTELEFFIDPADAPNVRKVRLDIISKDRGINRVVLITPHIAER